MTSRSESPQFEKGAEKDYGVPEHDVEAHLPPHNLMPALSTKSTHPLEQTETRQSYSKVQWILVCVALYSAAFLYGLDNTISAAIQAPAIAQFGSVEKLGWIGIGFPLGSIAVILPIGKAFGIFNIKTLFVSSLLMFVGGSALCGAAPTMNALIIGRVWAGAGGAGMYLGILNILSLNTTLAQRPFYFSLCGLIWGIGCILGPIIGGSFADSGATWRWAFYLNLVLFGVGTPVYFFVLKPFNPQPDVPFGEKMKNIDWVGVVLNAALYTTFVMAFTFGGGQFAWSSGSTIALTVVFGLLVITFAVQQTFSIFTTPERRLFPVDFLRKKSLLLQYIAMSAGVTGLFIPVYYIPLFFDFTRGDTNIDSAVRLLPFICVTIFCIMLNGTFMPKFGYYQPWYLASGLFLTIGGSLMYALVKPSTPNANVYGFSILAAIGAGLSQQAAYSVAQGKAPTDRIADAVGFVNSAQIGGIVIALTITSAVFQNIGYAHIAEAVDGLGFSPEEIHGALTGAKSAIFETVSPEVREKVIEGIVKAISDGYILLIVAGAVNLIAAFFMKRERLFMEITGGA
ncbi:MFS general substrate transporter [Microthyrium microscopicum]|uniref:MFS general substrate transporter n=1 Tax=Microthyrium microscopicum TaxID=703497 RepID=A0A6A6TYG0_9PEZI|nr:MFS general substrate transporter [Microthyrium microscopicum]